MLHPLPREHPSVVSKLDLSLKRIEENCERVTVRNDFWFKRNSYSVASSVMETGTRRFKNSFGSINTLTTPPKLNWVRGQSKLKEIIVKVSRECVLTGSGGAGGCRSCSAGLLTVDCRGWEATARLLARCRLMFCWVSAQFPQWAVQLAAPTLKQRKSKSGLII